MRWFFDDLGELEDSQSSSFLTNRLSLHASSLNQLLSQIPFERPIRDLLGLQALIEGFAEGVVQATCSKCSGSLKLIASLEELFLKQKHDLGYILICESMLDCRPPQSLPWTSYLEMQSWSAVIAEATLLRRADLSEVGTVPANSYGVLDVLRWPNDPAQLQKILRTRQQRNKKLALWFFHDLKAKGNLILELQSDYFCLECLISPASPELRLRTLSGQRLYDWSQYFEFSFQDLLSEKGELLRVQYANFYDRFYQICEYFVRFGLGDKHLNSLIEPSDSHARFSLFLIASLLKQIPALELFLCNLNRLFPDSDASWLEHQLCIFEEAGALVSATSSSLERRGLVELPHSVKLKEGFALSVPLEEKNVFIIRAEVSESLKNEVSLLANLNLIVEFKEFISNSVLKGHPQLSLAMFNDLRTFCIGQDLPAAYPNFSWRDLDSEAFVKLTANQLIAFGLDASKLALVRAAGILSALGLGEIPLFSKINSGLVALQPLLLAKALISAKVHGARLKGKRLIFAHALLDWRDSELPNLIELLKFLGEQGLELVVFDNSGRLLET